MPPPPDVWAIVVAAGSGARFGGRKQFELLGDRTLLEWSLAAAADACGGVVAVVPPDLAGDGPWSPSGSAPRCDAVVAGGATRSASVRAGLAAVPAEARIVVVHDAARPFAADLFAPVIGAVRAGAAGAVPGIPVADTVKVVDADGVVVETPPRDRLVAVQTPQAFDAAVLRAAHASEPEATDDAAVVEATGAKVVVVAGSERNRKVTSRDDLEWARRLVATEGS